MAEKSSSATEALRRIAKALADKPSAGSVKPGKKKRLTGALDEIADELRKKNP